jgi:hypothetical protein
MMQGIKPVVSNIGQENKVNSFTDGSTTGETSRHASLNLNFTRQN